MKKVARQFQNSWQRISPLVILGGILLGLYSGLACADPYDIGLKLYAQGNYKMAARYFLEAAGMTDNPNVHYYLADTYLKLDRFAEAQAEYQKVLAVAPDTQAAKLSKVALSHLHELLNGM